MLLIYEVIRGYLDTHYADMTREQIQKRFMEIHDEASANSNFTDDDLRLKLMEAEIPDTLSNGQTTLQY